MGSAELTVEPYRDWLIVEQAAAQEMSKGGVALPQRFQCKMSHGTVLKVGPGYRSEEGEWINVDGIRPGDVVYWAAAGGTGLDVQGREIYVIPARNVVLVEKVSR